MILAWLVFSIVNIEVCPQSNKVSNGLGSIAGTHWA